jgi:hypothetical protein
MLFYKINFNYSLKSIIELTLKNFRIILLFIISALIALATQKYIAIRLSSKGLLEYFQLINIISTLIIFITFGSENGVLRFFFEKNNRNSYYLSYFFYFSLLIAFLVSAFIYFDPLKLFNISIKNILSVFALTIPIYQACRHLFIVNNKGWLLTVFTITNTLIFLIALFYFNNNFFLQAYILTYVFCIFLYAILFRQKLWKWIDYDELKSHRIPGFLKFFYKNILLFSWISISSGLMLNLSQIFTRQILIDNIGGYGSAEFEVYQKICFSLTSIQTVFLSLKIFPELLKSKNKKKLNSQELSNNFFYDYRNKSLLFSLFNFCAIIILGPIIFYFTFNSVYKFSILLLLLTGSSETFRFFGLMLSSWHMAIGKPLCAFVGEIILYILPCLLLWIFTHSQLFNIKSILLFALLYLVVTICFSYFLYFNFKKFFKKIK